MPQKRQSNKGHRSPNSNRPPAPPPTILPPLPTVYVPLPQSFYCELNIQFTASPACCIHLSMHGIPRDCCQHLVHLLLLQYPSTKLFLRLLQMAFNKRSSQFKGTLYTPLRSMENSSRHSPTEYRCSLLGHHNSLELILDTGDVICKKTLRQSILIRAIVDR